MTNVLVDPSARLVIAHRGDSAHAPENTMEAFASAVHVGADALELDVRLTRDERVVVMHDADVVRTTSGQGLVSSLSIEQLGALDAGVHFSGDGGHTFPFRARRVRVPTLDQVLSAFPETPLLIEVKETRAALPAADVVRRHGAAARVVFGSEIDDAMRVLRKESFLTTASRPDALRLLRRACLGLGASPTPYRALSIPWRVGVLSVPVSRMARIARRAHVATHVWTVNDESRASRLWRAGVNGIVTDDPATMIPLKAALKSHRD